MVAKGRYKGVGRRRMFETDILRALLAYSLDIADTKIPAKAEFILSEVVNATILYTDPDEDLLLFREEQRKGRGLNYENRLWKKLEPCLSKSTIQPRVKSALANLLESHSVSYTDEHDRETLSYESNLYDSFYNIVDYNERPIEELPYSTFGKLNDYILPSLTDEEKKDLVGIGRLIRGLRREDIFYLRKIKQC